VTVIQTVLVYAGVPALILGSLALMVLGPGAVHVPRYRPGQPWDHKPVWYLPQPEWTPDAGGSSTASLEGRPTPAALPAGSRSGFGSDVPTAKGGAHGSW